MRWCAWSALSQVCFASSISHFGGGSGIISVLAWSVLILASVSVAIFQLPALGIETAPSGLAPVFPVQLRNTPIGLVNLAKNLPRKLEQPFRWRHDNHFALGLGLGLGCHLSHLFPFRWLCQTASCPVRLPFDACNPKLAQVRQGCQAPPGHWPFSSPNCGGGFGLPGRAPVV